MAVPEQRHEEPERPRPQLVLVLPRRPRRSRRRRFHVAAILAAGLYAGGAFVAYELVRSAWYGEGRVAGGAVEEPVPEAAADDAPLGTAEESAAIHTLAARAQQSVYVLESGGGGRGSGFVAWVQGGNSFLLTAHQTVQGVLADGGRSVFVRRGSQVWTGRIVRAHRPNGLALVRVDTDLGRPLWQSRGNKTKLEPGSLALVVPAGPDAAIGEGTAGSQSRGRIPVESPGDPLNVGAPVLGANGRLAGLVTDVAAGGVNRVVPIEGACEAGVRRCA